MKMTLYKVHANPIKNSFCLATLHTCQGACRQECFRWDSRRWRGWMRRLCSWSFLLLRWCSCIRAQWRPCSHTCEQIDTWDMLSLRNVYLIRWENSFWYWDESTFVPTKQENPPQCSRREEMPAWPQTARCRRRRWPGCPCPPAPGSGSRSPSSCCSGHFLCSLWMVEPVSEILMRN